MRRFWRLTLVVVVCAAALWGQTDSASLSGRVTDESGAVIAGADVTVTNVATGAAIQNKTNAAGVYTFPALRPGTYRLSIRQTGFQQALLQNLDLHVQDRVKQDFTLHVGSADQTVEVSGEAPLVNAESAAVGTTVDRDFVANMPLNGRSLQSLITLTPSVVVTQVNSGSPGQFSVNGQRPDSNYFTVDGVSANVGVASGGSTLAASQGAGVQPTAGGGFQNLASLDAIQEFTVQTSTFAPEFGSTPGGQISIATRSGTNHLHGDAFDYLRNNVLDANDWFLNGIPPKTGVPRHPPERQNDFGGVLGGPVWKNKVFFFASYEGLRLTQPTAFAKYVPSLCTRGTGSCPTGAAPAPAALQPYMRVYPLPTVGGCGNALAPSSDPQIAPFCQGFPALVKTDAGSIRVDYNVNSRLSIFGRYVNAPSSSITRGTGNATSIFSSEPNWTSYTGGGTYILTSHVLNDFRFNYTFTTGYATSTLDSFGGGVPISATDPIMFPAITLPDGHTVSPANTRALFGYTAAASWRFGEETRNEARQWDYVDSLSVSHGTHQLKFGTDFRRITPVQARPPYQQVFTFLTSADVKKGVANTYSNAFNPYTIWVFHILSLYAQDTWKLTPRLTLTYGARWEFTPAPGTLNHVPFLGLTQFDPNNLAATQVAPIGTPIYHNQWNAIAPRIGLAFQLSKDPQFGNVIRGGWGIFYDTNSDANTQGTTINGPNVQLASVGFPPSGFQQDPRNVNPNPNQAPWPIISTDSPNLRMPRIYQMNLAFEQSLGTSQTFSLTYAGAIGRNLFLNEAYPSPNATMPRGIQVITNDATSDYHSLQALYQRRLTKGLQAMASYVWSHSIDTSSNENYIIPGSTIEPITMERGPSDFDVRRSAQLALSYNVPSPGQNPLMRAVFGHWGTDLMFRARSAPPVNIIASAVNFSQLLPGQQIAERPNIVPGQPFYLYGAACAAAFSGSACPGGFGLNKAALSPPKAGTQGNLPRNFLRGYGWNDVDLTLRREFPLHERIALQFRADIFNVANHPAFALTGTALNFSNVAFGKSATMLDNGLYTTGGTPGFNPLYQIGGPRSIQLSLKLVF